MYIDTHAHLQFENFNNDLNETIEKAVSGGISHIINVGTNFDDCKFTLELAEKHENVYGTVGMHPNDSMDFNEEMFKEMSKMSGHPKIVAIGEIGLDYYWDESPKHQQDMVFRRYLDLAADKDMPVIIHTRNSFEDTVKVVKEYKGRVRGVFHCFSRYAEMYKHVEELGFFVSFTGNVSFTKKYKNIFQAVPNDKYMIETDCPFMTPVPFKGERNEPLYVKHTAEKIAEYKNVPVEEIGRETSETAKMLFKLP